MIDSILSVHITHKRASVDQLGKAAEQDASALMEAVASIPGVAECAVLRTCNRVEIYVVTTNHPATRRGLEDLINGLIPFGSTEDLVVYRSGQDSVRHLLRVASGLESMILGEDQIQGQVKEAYELAEREGRAGSVLSVVFRKAISVGKLVRTQTRVNKGCVSIGSAAVRLAESKLGTLSGKNILIVGAGEMATLIAKHLVGKGPQAVFVSNRTYSRAVELAWALNGQAVRFDSLIEFLARADVVLCATSATHMILTRSHMEKAMAFREGREDMIIIDVSIPRNVEVQVTEVPGVELFDIDGLRGIAEENVLKRRAEIRSAERIIAHELESLESRMKALRAEELISRLYINFGSLKERELRKALNRLGSGAVPVEEVLEDFANSLTNKFLSGPTECLKEASRGGDLEVLELVEELFKIKGDMDVPAKQAEKAAHGSRH